MVHDPGVESSKILPADAGMLERKRADSSDTAVGDSAEEVTVTHKGIMSGSHALHHITTLPSLPEKTGITQRKQLHPWIEIAKRLAPSVLAVFIGSILVVTKPVAALSGTADYEFLIVVAITLFFHPANHTIGMHIQWTVIGIVGAVIGIGWSALAFYISTVANKRANSPEGGSSVGARVACAVLLATIAFAAADAKSRYPRLTSGCVLSVFVTIWLISMHVRTQVITSTPFLGMLYAILFAAGTSMVVSMVVFPKSASKLLAQQLIDTLGHTSELLVHTLHLFQMDPHRTSTVAEYRELRERVIKLRHTLTADNGKLRPAYEDAKFEITFALFPLDRYEAFINLSLKLQTILVSRMGLKINVEGDLFDEAAVPDYDTGHETPLYLRTLVDELGKMNLYALNTIRDTLAKASKVPSVRNLDLGQNAAEEAGGAYQIHDFFKEKKHQKLRERLDSIVASFRTEIVEAIDKALMDPEKNHEGAHKLFRTHAFKDCFFFTSLVELSNEIQNGLLTVTELPQPANGARRRFWIPALSSLLERSRSMAVFSNNVEDDEAAQRDIEEKEDEYKRHRILAGIEAKTTSQLPFIQLQSPGTPLHRRFFRIRHHTGYVRRLRARVYEWWSSPAVYMWRLRVDENLNSIQHSRHLKHAFKCALGVSLLSLPGHLPASTPGFQWYESVKGPWIPITLLYCLQTSTAATYRDAFYRTIGTVVGALYGLAGQKIAHNIPYGIVAVMVFQALFTNYMVVIQPRFYGIGTVGQVAVTSVIFTPYLGLKYKSAVNLACLRAQNIEIGIVAALILNVFLWPYHARVQLIHACAKATDKLNKLYLSMSRQVVKRNHVMDDDVNKEYEKLEEETRMALTRASNLCHLVHIEASLLPKPVKKYEALIRNLTELLNLFSGLRAIRKNIPRKVTVVDVLPERTELISSILIILHAISHSLHTHAPVPQFLPHPRLALEHLVAAIENHVEELVNSPTSASAPDSIPMPSIQSTLVSSTLGASLKSNIQMVPPSPAMGPGSKLGFSFAFALAENEAISEAVETLGNIIETCKDLYGVASFIHQEEVQNLVNAPAYMTTHVKTPARRSFSASPVPSRTNSVQLSNPPRRPSLTPSAH